MLAKPELQKAPHLMEDQKGASHSGKIPARVPSLVDVSYPVFEKSRFQTALTGWKPVEANGLFGL